MFCGMEYLISRLPIFPSALLRSVIALVAMTIVFFAPALAQNQAHRLILKDGSYQSVTKYEVHAERVRYFSAERGEWEEVPSSLIDWDATDKFEQGRAQGKIAPEALELDKQLEAERQAEQARSPQVAPGLRLPEGGGIFLLDTYQNQAQLAELQQSGGQLEKNTKSNILRAAINPMAGTKQTIELPDPHAKIQAHSAVPSLYINIESSEEAPPVITNKTQTSPAAASPFPDSERFKILRVEVKGGKRIAGAIKIAVTGKMKSDSRFVASTTVTMTGGWVKLTPTEPLASGEYAVAEMLGKDGMNLYVWDFGVNPSASPNASALKPEPTATQTKTDQPTDLKKREER
jgi:hypothetical protein